MSERRDRSADVHMKDGIFRRGRVIGHSDAQGRIREADGAFFRGEELGQVDERHRIRRKGGVVGRGEVVGRIRGNAAYGRPGLLGSAPRLGHVDAEGNVWQEDCAAFRGRIVGKARGADPEAALAYFVLKFEQIAGHVATLEEKVSACSDKFTFLPRVRAMLAVLPEIDALGDFDDLVRRLESLEQTCAEQLGDHFEREDAQVLGLRDSMARLGEAANLETLRNELSIAGRDSLGRAERLVKRARGALGLPGNHGDEGPRAGASPRSFRPAPRRPSDPPFDRLDVGTGAEALSPLEGILTSTLLPMEKLREEVDRFRRDPEYGTEELWDRVRSTVASLVEYRDMTTAMVGRIPLGLPENGAPLALPQSTASSVSEPRVTSPTPGEGEAAGARTRDRVEALLDSPAITQVFAAIDGAIEGLESMQRAREDGVNGVRAALDEGLDGLRSLQKAREEGVAGLRDALHRLGALADRGSRPREEP